MKKRLFALILTLALLLPLVPAPACAAETDLESEIRQQLTAYVSTLSKPNASGAKTKLINHALYGKGKYLSMGETDVFTVAALNANLMQESLVRTLAEAVRFSQSHNNDLLYIGGDTEWYTNALSFYSALYKDEQMSDAEYTNLLANLISPSKENGLVISANACDNAMIDVVGSGRLRIILRRTSVDYENVSYCAEIKLADDFDFNGSQTTGTIIAGWLTGTLIDTYSWDATAEFTFTVPNICAHTPAVPANYHWVCNENGLVSVPGQDCQDNPLTLLEGKVEDGVFHKVQYQMSEEIVLRRDYEWAIEWKMTGPWKSASSTTMRKFLGELDGLDCRGMVISFSSQRNYIGMGQAYRDNVHEIYCVSLSDYGIDMKDTHVYRLVNRIEEDGYNMVWLWVDGKEIAPMDLFNRSFRLGTEIRDDYLSGMDFRFSYIGNQNHLLDSGSIEYIRVWESLKEINENDYRKTTTTAPTCTEPGKIVHTCSLCGASYEEATGEPALGHAWDDGTVTTPATCETDGEIRFTCNHDPSHTRVDTITPPGHTPGDPASCTAAQTCNSCGFELSPALGHTWNNGELVSKPTPEADGVTKFTCLTCGEIREETQKYEGPIRIAGRDRFETALLTADRMKKNLEIEKFDAVIVASGLDFADALAGSYLASTKNAPILLAYTKDSVNDGIRHYIRENLKEGGTVYILGGENAVPAAFEEELETFEVKRLAGGNRFETNLLILKEAGISDKPLLISTGLTFADSLSASAANLPILLVYGDKLLPEQADFLEANKGRSLYILGGEGAVSGKMEDVLKLHGTVERVAGGNRFETSVKIAEKFFDSPESAVLAYAWDFPDGLCGGPLAVTMNAPLILTMANYEESAANYVQSKTISKATILGGEKLIPDTSVDLIMK